MLVVMRRRLLAINPRIIPRLCHAGAKKGGLDVSLQHSTRVFGAPAGAAWVPNLDWFAQVDLNTDGKISRAEWAAFRTKITPFPTRLQLRRHAIACAVPMVGFGAMDNFIMIQAGDLIDSTLGVTFGLATMTAAACGQICSDFSGVMFGGTVEALANRLGLPMAGLTVEQAQLRPVKILSTVSAGVGVVIGCLVGMCCLLFMDLDKADRLKKAEELEHIFTVVFKQGKQLLQAQQVNLYLLDDSTPGKVFVNTRKSYCDPPTNEALDAVFNGFSVDGQVAPDNLLSMLTILDTKIDSSAMHNLLRTFDLSGDGSLNREEFEALVYKVVYQRSIDFEMNPNGFLQEVFNSNRITNIKDADQHPTYLTSRMRHADALCHTKIYSLLYGPVRDQNGKVIGIIQMKNKQDPNGLGLVAFTKDDEKLLELLCSHVALFINR
eukprot:TRINITY_DN7300_c0_g4_i1.p1 TRINITY_DN7300_c0_g4~~TRINITY_DN7300_c0_g4_i1.p1  ORF type:complete len:436 (-),score=83.04 TRINITY_DN7300_c0_g4_i1:299-1606(-)